MSPNLPTPDDLPELLAGYLDGELNSEERACVDHWLRSHPEAQEKLISQRLLSPQNEEFWRQVSPPTPSEASWAKVFAGIELGLDSPIPSRGSTEPVREKSRWKFPAAFALFSVTLASVFFLLIMPTSLLPVRSDTARTSAFLAEPIELASANEVQILSLDESAFSGLVIGEHPLTHSPLVLASFEEVDLHGIEPDLEGEFPELQMTPHGTTSPMIWAKVDLRFPK